MRHRLGLGRRARHPEETSGQVRPYERGIEGDECEVGLDDGGGDGDEDHPRPMVVARRWAAQRPPSRFEHDSLKAATRPTKSSAGLEGERALIRTKNVIGGMLIELGALSA